MKKAILILCLVAASLFTTAQSQTVEPVKTEQNKQASLNLTKNSTNSGEVWTAKDGTKYTVYLGAKGGKYVVRRSQKTGELYKYYLPK
jgi:hypothetical protein